MKQISKNFNLKEFNVSATGSRLGIKNEIPEELIPNIERLVVKLLQPLCDLTGWYNLITSGYRSPELNKAVGGVPSSQHLTAEASDNNFYTKVEGKTQYIAPIDVLRVLKESGLDFDQAIAYPNFVHLSFTNKRANRKQFLYSKNYKGARL